MRAPGHGRTDPPSLCIRARVGLRLDLDSVQAHKAQSSNEHQEGEGWMQSLTQHLLPSLPSSQMWLENQHSPTMPCSMRKARHVINQKTNCPQMSH